MAHWKTHWMTLVLGLWPQSFGCSRQDIPANGGPRQDRADVAGTSEGRLKPNERPWLSQELHSFLTFHRAEEFLDGSFLENLILNPSPLAPGSLPPPVASRQPVHRFNTGVYHFYSLSLEEGLRAGFQPEGIGFHAYTDPVPGSVELRRCYFPVTAKHTITRTGNCPDGILEGSYGFLAGRNSPGTQEVLSCTSPDRRDFLVTIHRVECERAGYSSLEMLGAY